MSAVLDNLTKVQPAFKTGAGIAWGYQASYLFYTVAEFFRPGYQNNLVNNWLPALDGVVTKLQAGAAAHIRQSLKPEGSWMIVEPMAGDRLENNLNPVGRIYYAASTMVCVPTSLSQAVGAAVGAQAGEATLREVIMSSGFRNVRGAAQTPFNMILEARP
jgi:hypothetical protein